MLSCIVSAEDKDLCVIRIVENKIPQRAAFRVIRGTKTIGTWIGQVYRGKPGHEAVGIDLMYFLISLGE